MYEKLIHVEIIVRGMLVDELSQEKILDHKTSGGGIDDRGGDCNN